MKCQDIESSVAALNVGDRRDKKEGEFDTFMDLVVITQATKAQARFQ